MLRNSARWTTNRLVDSRTERIRHVCRGRSTDGLSKGVHELLDAFCSLLIPCTPNGLPSEDEPTGMLLLTVGGNLNAGAPVLWRASAPKT